VSQYLINIQNQYLYVYVKIQYYMIIFTLALNRAQLKLVVGRNTRVLFLSVNLSTFYITPWNWVLIQMLIVRSASQEIPPCHRTRRYIAMFTRPRQSTYPKTYFLKFHFNNILQSMPRSSVTSLPFRLSNQNFVRIFNLSHARYMPHPSHLPWFDYPNNILWKVQIIELIIMQISPASLPASTLFSNRYYN
jgi:hypothetical protein